MLAARIFAGTGDESPARKTHEGAWEMADKLRSTEPTQRLDAIEALAEKGVSQAELIARAYPRIANDLAQHEARIAALEKRRRDLLNDYEALQVIPPRVLSDE